MVRHQTSMANAPPSLVSDAGSAPSRMRLSTHIALAATVLTLGFVLAAGGLSYIVTRRQLIENQDIALENQAILYAQQLGNTLRSITATLGTLPENALILNSLMDSLTRQTALVPFLKDFSRISEVPVTLLVTDFQGQPIAGNYQVPFEAHDWQHQVLETGKLYAAIGTDAAGDYLFVAEPIFYSRTLSPEGALLYKIVLAYVQSSLPAPSEGGIMLRLVYPKQGMVSLAAVLSGDLQDPDRLAHVEMLPLPAGLKPLWIAVEVSTDRSALTASLNRLLLLYATIGTGMVLVVAALAQVGAHYLTRPLRELQSVAQSIIESGSLEHRFAFHGVFEVEQLGRAFNQMLEQLDSAHRQLQRQTELETERNQALAAVNMALEQEIRERERAETALRENEERLRLALKAAHQGLYDLNMQTGEAIVSPEYARMLGYGPNELQETKAAWIKRLHPDDYEPVARTYKRYVSGKLSDYRVECRQRTRGGDWIWILSLGSIVQWDDKGKPLRMLGTHTDITERKQAESALAVTVEELRVAEQRQRELLMVTRREQGRLRALLAAMNVGILFEDNQQHVEYLNPAFLRMWAIDETLDLVGQPMRKILEHSTHRLARPDHASRYVLQVLDTHEISERFEINLYDGRLLTQMSYPVLDTEDRMLGRLWLYEDITHERQTAQQLLYLAERDPLTGLFNRHSFQKYLEQKIASSLRSSDKFAVIYFDLDEFKAINDTFGHRAGDMVLVRTAGEITTHVRATEMFARLGGDEFAIISTIGAEYEPSALPARIAGTVSAIPFRFRGTNLRLTASVGVAFFPEHGENIEDLVAHADTAMYQAKNQGKNTWAIYDPRRDSTEVMVRRLNWHSRIAQALEGQLFELHFQGVYHIKDRSLSHLEVLIRMRNSDESGHLILPGQFIPLSEKSGQVLDIDRWVLQKSIALLGRSTDLPPLAVNISGRTFDDPALPQNIQRLLTQHGVDPQRLLIELTETAAVSDVQDAQRFIEAIQQVGCGVCLDDFGSGFSTFAYLKYLNVKILKIDGLFVRDLLNHYDNQVFIRAMVEVARGLRKTTVAEFVEDAATLDMLRDLGVDLVQGYHLDRPSAEHPALDCLAGWRSE
ncbi:MAG: EAL domain-containing protein [Candidatus Competibacteraceae bacterium]|nr:EAL domain-containing protein [Candidatus Competibacteraceae bacterium]MCP5133771.1 EAL domain-containing protein [Gammaproteobacteria bacterium]